ncbi:Beta-galactosidase [Drechslerella dactyloides]|uniref:Beta-galactosidase n=1 Tax=Drechslerella dactyloides TaxID=74499 RepID=A0AAD6IZH3_DREDA|nr:Beta-galactosidase [Drechslerella dactyloides]
MVALSKIALLAAAAHAAVIQRDAPAGPKIRQTGNGQNVVTWDQYSFYVNGGRVMIYSGEVHPFRNPVQDLHLDILQKIKALGFNAVSIYVHWGIVEYERGKFNWDGVFDLQPFFDAAKAAGLWVIARPGPYINAESAGGGLPGWGARVEGQWRNSNPNYTAAWQAYIDSVGKIIAKNQITKGGPVILAQPENEYSGFMEPDGSLNPNEDTEYERLLLEAFDNAGIEVPTVCNDAWIGGHFTSVDVYGYDNYPAGFNCQDPLSWPDPPDYFYASHKDVAPNTPNAILEFQGGSFDSWGGYGFEQCYKLIGPEMVRVYNKNTYASATHLLNIYMIYGGTNWGHLSNPGGYSSYDYAAAIAEDRTLREKYYELKLQANFLAVSPAYLTSAPVDVQRFPTAGSNITITELLDQVGGTQRFYIVRQTKPAETTDSAFSVDIETSIGKKTVPQLGSAQYVLPAHDSKIIVTDYPAGDVHVLYSTLEIMTWKVIDGRTVILLYANTGESGEIAIRTGTAYKVDVRRGKASTVTSKRTSMVLTLQVVVGHETVVALGEDILLYVVDRVNAYNFWVPDVNLKQELPVIIKGGYLLRTAAFSGNTLSLTGDTNRTTVFEIIAPKKAQAYTWNGARLDTSLTRHGTQEGRYRTRTPRVDIPDLARLKWKYIDSLPEVSGSYDDSKWVTADHTYTHNKIKPTTPVILYASDYGFHSGNILWRGHFTAAGGETTFNLTIQGGNAFAYSVWDGDEYLGSFRGAPAPSAHNGSYMLAGPWKPGSSHVITILQDHMGLEQNWFGGEENFKSFRGLSDYSFGGATPMLKHWKVTGNLGGEKFADWARGGYNEGGLYAVRKGFHLPGLDDSKWDSKSPLKGINGPGIEFYRTTFTLNVPNGVDYPMSIDFGSRTNKSLRVEIYVNGWQFGKYTDDIGPQTSFPVPQGILNYKGENTLALSLWSLEEGGAALATIDLVVRSEVEGGVGSVRNSPGPSYTARAGSY